MIIRDAINKDISKIAQVHVDTWRTTYQGILLDDILENLSYEKRENSWHQVFENAQKNGNFTYVAEDKLQQIVGFANGGIERTGDPFYRGELNAIYILKNYQQKGIGPDCLTHFSKT
ncbi:MAG: GNAT family N-acetyltransferase [Xenococcaceae cyanobacterium MO_167.B52]|nr:GNAT family N-acetyltransferase [Xenococcaceae cyanobacterium MO_167.B52]